MGSEQDNTVMGEVLRPPVPMRSSPDDYSTANTVDNAIAQVNLMSRNLRASQQGRPFDTAQGAHDLWGELDSARTRRNNIDTFGQLEEATYGTLKEVNKSTARYIIQNGWEEPSEDNIGAILTGINRQLLDNIEVFESRDEEILAAQIAQLEPLMDDTMKKHLRDLLTMYKSWKTEPLSQKRPYDATSRLIARMQYLKFNVTETIGLFSRHLREKDAEIHQLQSDHAQVRSQSEDTRLIEELAAQHALELQRIKTQGDLSLIDLENQHTERVEAITAYNVKKMSEMVTTWKEVLFAFLLHKQKDAWTTVAGTIDHDSEMHKVFVILEQIRSVNFIHAGKLETWLNVVRTVGDRRVKDPKLLILEIWYKLVHPHLLPTYDEVLDLGANIHAFSMDDLDFMAACLENGLAVSSQMINPSPSQWTASECKAWLRLADFLCIFYDGQRPQLNFDMSIAMNVGRESILVDGLFEYVYAKMSGTPTDSDAGDPALGSFITQKARDTRTGIVHEDYDIVPDGKDLIIVSHRPEAAVYFLSSEHFSLNRTSTAYDLVLNHLEYPEEAVKLGFSAWDKASMNVVFTLMIDALDRYEGGNDGFVKLPIHGNNF